MSLLVASIMMCLLTCTLAASSDTNPFRCDHPLRRLPSLSHLFTHCECSRSEWTDWATIGTSNAPECSSGRAVIEERRQIVITGDCNETVQRNATCEPTSEEKLILLLGLGSRGHSIEPKFNGCRGRRSNNFDPIFDPNRPPFVRPNPFHGNSTNLIQCRLKRSTCERHQMCSSIIGRRRRSVKTEMKTSHININSHSSNAELEPEPDNPIPFDMLKHGHRYRRNNHRECSESQHILFVLDTSGSIGLSNFRKMTSALSCLMPLFCNPIQVGVITFSHNYFIEFCFDCFDNTCEGRNATANAIRAIPYRGGFTYTGGVVRCVNELLTNQLQEMCNFDIDDDDTHCLDVVFITDGYSNGPLDVCHEIKNSRLHNDSKIEVHAIGIGNSVNMAEINCLSKGHTSIFFPTFEEFIDGLDLIVYLLTNAVPDNHGNPYTCTHASAPKADNNTLCNMDACNAI